MPAPTQTRSLILQTLALSYQISDGRSGDTANTNCTSKSRHSYYFRTLTTYHCHARALAFTSHYGHLIWSQISSYAICRWYGNRTGFCLRTPAYPLQSSSRQYSTFIHLSYGDSMNNWNTGSHNTKGLSCTPP